MDINAELHETERTLVKFLLSYQKNKSWESAMDYLTGYVFYNPGVQEVYNIIKKYYDTYGKPISKNILMAEIREIKEEYTKELIKREIQEMSKLQINDDIEYFISKFNKNSYIINLMSGFEKIANSLKTNEYSNINDVLLSMMRNGESHHIEESNINFHDVDSWLIPENRKCVSTGYPYLDKVMAGGLGEGELGIILGSAGSGKSWLLTALGLNAIKNGLNVLHISLELYENQAMARYGSLLMQMNTNDLLQNKEKVKKEIGKLTGKLTPKVLVSRKCGGATVNTVRALIKKYSDTNLIIIDYGDKMISGNKFYENTYLEQGQIYDDLRALSFETKIPIWTASQANRTREETGAFLFTGNIADSYRKVMIADFIMSIHRNNAYKNNKKAGYAILKNRFGYDGMTFTGDCDFGTGIINISDPNDLKNNTSTKTLADIAKDNMQKLLKKESVNIIKGNSYE